MKRLCLLMLLSISLCGCTNENPKDPSSGDLQYVVKFETNGGSSINDQSVSKGNKISKPSDPVREGYTFKNWTYNGEEWSFIGYSVTENMTLVANWDINVYSITYNLDQGRNNSENPETYTINDSFTFLEPTKYESVFNHWEKDGETITDIKKGTTGDITLTAIWDVNQYEVNAISVPNEGGTVTGAGTFDYGSDTILTAHPNEGYAFEGWYNSSSIDKNLSTNPSYVAFIPANDITMYANFVPIEYKINYVLNGGTNNVENPTKYTVQDSYTLKNPSGKTGYTFDHWEINGEVVASIEKGTTGDITLTAIWAIDKYQINVVLNDDEGGTISGVGAYNYNSNVILSATPNKGYTFEGWFDSSTFNYRLSKNLGYSVTVGTSDVTIYAKFTPIIYAIYYELNGGTNNSDNPYSYTVKDTIVLKSPLKRTGYTFEGWASYEGEAVATIEKGTTGDISLEAIWSANKYDVNVYSLDETKGTVTGSGKYDFGSDVVITATACDDYVFNGWYFDSSLTELVSKQSSFTFTMPAEDVSLYANFCTEIEESDEQKVWEKNHGITPTIDEKNEYLTYGLYPRTNVDDNDLINALNRFASPQATGWYLYGNEYYAKVIAKPYDNYEFSNGVIVQNNQTYWFKCEPIVWKILSIEDGNYFVISSNLLDVYKYSTTSNDYGASHIRIWLNDQFYNSAFNLNSSYILTTEVNNSESTTCIIDLFREDYNRFACDNTFDKVFLPSYADVFNTKYGFITKTNQPGQDDCRLCSTTDWTKANGGYSSTGSMPYYDTGKYWTRSPAHTRSTYATSINYYGEPVIETPVGSTSISVRPCITLKIK